MKRTHLEPMNLPTITRKRGADAFGPCAADRARFQRQDRIDTLD
jgi:hypothetical protein